MLRIICLLIINFCNQVIATSPNTGNEMGQKEGDCIKKGNDFISYSERLSTILIMTVLYILHVFVYYDASMGIMDVIYTLIVIYGTIICMIAYQDLGQFYTFEIGIRKDHKIITTGLYGHVAHPGYLGQIMTLMGTILFCHVNGLLTFLLVMYTTYRFSHRIKNEEEMMIEYFGDEYKRYLGSTSRLIPRIF